MKKWMILSGFAAVGAVAMTAAAAAFQPAPASPPSLYSRIGGFDGIAALVDDFAPRLGTDPKLARLFGGHGMESQLRQRQLAILYICEKAGGPCNYIGRPMKNTHAGLGITESDWTLSMQHLAVSMDKLKIQGKEREELMAMIGAIKKDVVDTAAPAAPTR